MGELISRAQYAADICEGHRVTKYSRAGGTFLSDTLTTSMVASIIRDLISKIDELKDK